MERREVILATANQTVTFRSPWGRPTATPTVQTATSGNSELSAAADTNVTLDAVNTTVDASAAQGAKMLSVTSAAGIEVDKGYLLTNKYGQKEQVWVQKIDGTDIYLVDELRNAADKLDTTYGSFEGIEFVYALQTDDVAVLNEMNVATALFTAGGQPRAQRLVYDVVRVPLNAPGPLTAEAVYTRLGWDNARKGSDGKRGHDLKPQRYTAWNVVRRRLLQHGSAKQQWRPSMVVSPEDLFEFGIAALIRICHQQGIIVDQTEPTREELLATETREQLAAFPSISWLDRAETKVRTEDDTRPATLDYYR